MSSVGWLHHHDDVQRVGIRDYYWDGENEDDDEDGGGDGRDFPGELLNRLFYYAKFGKWRKRRERCICHRPRPPTNGLGFPMRIFRDLFA